MAVLKSNLSPPLPQQGGLRFAMRDVQVSIGDYYREAAGASDPEALATRVRAMFLAPEDPRIGVIRAFAYARHLMQHVLHPVRPDPSCAIGGNAIGLRTYAVWAPTGLLHEWVTT